LISTNAFDQQGGVNASALLVSTIDNGEDNNQLAIDLMGNVGIRGHFESLLVPLPPSSRDATADAESLLDALPFRVYRLPTDPSGSLPRIGAVNSVASGAVSPAQPVAIDLTASVAVDVAATRQLIREVAELKAEVASLKRQVGER
jgi:hypothetical protein